MPLLNSPFNVDDIRGIVYTFPLVNDELPWHTHDESTAHITICARGHVYMEVGPSEGVVTETHDIPAGAAVDTDAGLWHRIVAKQPNSRIFNLSKRAPCRS